MTARAPVGIVRVARRPAGWRAPGPAPAGPQGRPELSPQTNEDLCFLSGDWRLFQHQRGHRWSLDDLVTAWVAVGAAERRGAPEEHEAHHELGQGNVRALDLGCGLGSVLLMVAWKIPGADVTGIELQPDRAGMGRRSIAYNGVADRCRIVDGDLRDLRGATELGRAIGDARFDLITGTPPYFPRGTGTESPLPQITPCRFELHGGVEDYLAAAAPRLARGGRIVVCSAALERDRVRASAERHQLTVRSHWDVVPRQGKPVLVMVDVLAASSGGTASTTDEHTLIVRERGGAWTPAFRAVRAAMGLPPTTPAGG